ncbi:methyl-accepting chemotaxis protein [Clostridium tetanomorphum]|uniref:Methyl-accepting chemotaxis protein n=1 Tax=Clostridium tetanomorphum TaxID=1553 RepID=A0A923E910_CLOTT|nr:hypothetical protein [Clostridium tetanomorphum]KAJ49750.1 methyl-accepting chemotaxis protein [Clostridium tetanomorphum DSM 665]KAJ53151.1 methyl-accepting chemotaxis protein [Clostridium tetanomorphum DSM 665]MBC2396946.1 hypothetical protein [Clostridium tetanomorphum]MBP1863087.1 methyl-accepting chemotaxis protein [Clostridium tetanomorphum]NRS84196.1 methyl-accepting chemotaxis protein [Clostridium tetanomorphum]
MSAVSKEMIPSSQNVSQAIQDIAKGTGSQADELVDISSILNYFSEELDNIVKSIKNVDVNVRDINNKAEVSEKELEQLYESINNSLATVISKVSNLDDRVKK